MSLTAVEIMDEVMGLSGFFPSGSYAASVDQDDKLIFSLLRRAARDIAKYRWTDLVRTGRIDITEATDTYPLPDDWREFIPNSIKTDNDLRPLNFPSDFGTWSRIDSKVGPTGIQHHLQIRQGSLEVLPSSSQAYTIRFDYISNFPVLKAGTTDTLIKTFVSDGDLWLLDEDLIIKGLKLKWSIEKRLDTVSADLNDYKSYDWALKGTQAGAQKVALGGRGIYYPGSPYTNLWK